MRRIVPASLFALLPLCAAADITVSFVEGAPKDSFVFMITDCAQPITRLSLDLSPAPAGLIFDVTADGAGVAVFQPLQVQSGEVILGRVTDGDQVLPLEIRDFTPGTPAMITLDIDDTLANSQSGQIIVRGGEIEGAIVRVQTDTGEATGTFDTAGQATIPLPDCIS